MSTQGVFVRIRAFRYSIKGEVADGYNVVGVGRGDTAGTKSSAVVGEIACVTLRAQREILMVAE